jgi:hypothetical protein
VTGFPLYDRAARNERLGGQAELGVKWAEAKAELLGETGPMLTSDSQAHR